MEKKIDNYIRLTYDLFIDNDELTASLLKANFANKSYISLLSKKHIIKRTSKAHYSLMDIKGLEAYAEEILASGDRRRYEICKEKIEKLKNEQYYNIDPLVRKLYDLFIAEVELTTENLLAAEIPPSSAMEQGFIQPQTNGTYRLLWISELELYGDRLKAEGDIDRAEVCYRKYSENKSGSHTVEEGKNIVYETFIDHDKLTLAVLSSAGLSNYDSLRLAKMGYLKKSSYGLYEITKLDEFYSYGEAYESQGNLERANKCYEKYALLTDDPKIILKVAKYYLNREEYPRGFNVLTKIKEGQGRIYGSIFNYYLFLLSFVIKLPDEYRLHAKNIDLEMLTYPSDHLMPDLYREESEFKRLIYSQKFKSARKKLDSMPIQAPISWQDELSKKLLDTIIRYQRDIRGTIIRAITMRDIDTLMKVLLRENHLHILKKEYYNFLLIASDISALLEGKVLRNRTPLKEHTLSEYIRTGHYDEALKKSLELGNEKGIDVSQNHPALLLIWFQDVKKSMGTSTHQTAPCTTSKIQDALSKQNTVYNKINRLLITGHKSEALQLISANLSRLGLSRYYYIIAHLIDIAYAKRDLDFIQPLGTFIKVTKGTFDVEVETYVKDAEDALKSGSPTVANMYLNLIVEIKKQGDLDLSKEGFISLFTNLKAQIKNQIKSSTIDFKPVDDGKK